MKEHSRTELIMLRCGWLAAALALLLAVSPAAAAAQAKASASQARIVALLEKSGFGYTKVGDGVWEVPATGKNLKEFAIRVVAVDDILLVIARIADRKDLVVQEPLLLKLAELNHHFDTAKLALSDDMLYARMDIHTRLVDEQEMKYLIQQIAEVVDEAYPQLKPFIRE